MSNNLLTNDISNDLLLENKVVVMEDSDDTKKAIFNLMEDQLKWEVVECKDQDEAVKIAEQKDASFFILDNWVGENKQEGLDALERIKNINEKNFVAIITAHSVTQELSKRLGSNLFVEKDDLILNIFHIVEEMLKYRLKIVDNLPKVVDNTQKEIERELKNIKVLERNYKRGAGIEGTRDKRVKVFEDPQAANRLAYKMCKLNSDWSSKHQGKYAAFVDGEFKFSCEDRDEFFNRLINSDEYKEKPIFFAKVEEKKRIIDEPTSLWFELI
ncbi:MAG: response regulator [Prochloraceae cyanobacterium]|nr:response regulator [Prochloraceae cyanobacterium]